MFTSLRRQTPHLLRLRTAPSNLTSSIASLRTLSSLSQSNSHTLLHSNAPEARSVTPVLQKRFFALSSFKRDNSGYAAEAVLESIDSNPQAAAYVHGHVEASDAPITRFSQLVQRGLVDARIVDVITKGMGFEEMTKVQCKTIVETVAGGDVLAQAKTGTGKTIAFLLPVLQRLLHSPKPLQVPTRFSHTAALDIRAIIISPTRELALQIERDAQVLIKNTPIIIQSAVGGTGKSFSLRKMHKEGCHILIATPGRLNDLLSDGQANVTTQNLEMLVLDEADNLLDQGFSREIDQVLRQLPPRDSPTASSVAANKPESRQTLLFSATVPDKVLDMVKRTLRKNYKFLKMVEKGEAATHQRVEQRLIQCKNFENLMPAILELCKREIAAAEASFEGGGAEPKKEVLPFKTIVFFPTTRTASLAAETFRGLGSSNGGFQSNHPLKPARIIEIHSRLSQEQRTKAASMFRKEKSAILFSSDVTARGMDFPNVTHVIQVGYPMNLEQYIHRLGRTARGDKTGVGYLLLTDVEHNIAMRELGKMPFLKDDSISTANIDMAAEQSLPKSTAEILMSITEASLKVDPRNKAKAYMALLGYYAQVKNRQHLVDCVNRWSRVGFGMETPPPIPKMLVGKMGLNGVQGINVATGNDYADDDRPSRSFNNRPSRSSGFGTGGFRPPRRDFGDRSPRRGFSSGGGRPPVDDLSGDESPKIEELDEDSVLEPESDGERSPKSDFGGDRPPRRDFNSGSYGDRPPRRDFNSGGYGDRPPRRDFGDRPPRGDFGDRPPRGDFGGDRPPRRDFNGGGYGDRPPRRDFGAGGDRPPRRDFGAGGSYGDRPPRRDFGDRPPRNDFGGDRPPRRDFGAGGSYERPPRRDFGDRPPRNDFGGDRPPRRDFGAGGDRPPRRDFGDRPPRGDFPPKRDGRDYNAKAGGAFGGKPKAPWQMRGKVNK